MSDEPVYQLSFAQRIMVLITVMLGNTIYAASVLISSALLPQLQGAMSATQDEVSWVMTFNIVATAVATPATGWLADRFSQRSIMIWSATIFTVATFMCGASRTLEELIFWRIVQGAAGAPLVPLGQSFLLDSFPRRQHATVISIFGMANMIGPSLGPMFAGQISESLGLAMGVLDDRAGRRRGGGQATSCSCRAAAPTPVRGSIGSASSASRPALPRPSWCSRAASASTGSRAPRSSSRP